MHISHHQSSPLYNELSLPSSPVISTKVRRRRRENTRKRASSVSPVKNSDSCQRRQARADRKAALLEEQALLLSARKQRLEQGKSRGGALFSFSLHLPDLSSILDEDGYLTFPDLTEMRFLPECAQNFLPIRSPSVIPCFLFIFFFLLSTSFSVPYALTLSFPLALCLCYLEPKAATLTASIVQGYHDYEHDSSEEEEVCASICPSLASTTLIFIINLQHCPVCVQSQFTYFQNLISDVHNIIINHRKHMSIAAQRWTCKSHHFRVDLYGEG